MSLTEQLNDLKQQLGQEIPHEILMDIGQFVQGLVQSGIEKTSCQWFPLMRFYPGGQRS
jgi:hypothetical protein